ncbi:MAG: NAD-dependent malic enzyme [bacterium]|nr:NAD-dependent malic enzyme [bacterium]
MHDDQHGAAIVVLAGLINACKVVGKNVKTARIVVAGAGAAGYAVATLLHNYGATNILVVDREGIIHRRRPNLPAHKKRLAKITNPKNVRGTLQDALTGADVLVGVSGPGTVVRDDVRMMQKDAIVFALANPTPEIMPEEAKKGGAGVVATGRSDFPNQINNALVFPGIFRGALDCNVRNITEQIAIRAAKNLAHIVKKPTANKIIPDLFDKRVVKAVASAVR